MEKAKIQASNRVALPFFDFLVAGGANQKELDTTKRKGSFTIEPRKKPSDTFHDPYNGLLYFIIINYNSHLAG